MAIRWRRYHSQCKGKRNEGDKYGKVIEKGIECEGKRGKHCPEGIPSPCGTWAIDYREIDGRWVSKVFPGISKTEAKERLERYPKQYPKGIDRATTGKKDAFAERIHQKVFRVF